MTKLTAKTTEENRELAWIARRLEAHNVPANFNPFKGVLITSATETVINQIKFGA